MPRFYFHYCGDSHALDGEGREFESFELALVQATHEARDAAAHNLREGKLHLDHGLEIVSEAGEVLREISFRDVVTICP